MGSKLSAEEAGAYEALDKLLYRQWDPIGVYAFDGPSDEYHAYLPGFWLLVRDGAPVDEVASYLARVEREVIMLETSENRRMDIALKAGALVRAWRMPVRP